MDGLPAETVDVLDDLIAQSEAHRDEHIATLHTLGSRGGEFDGDPRNPGADRGHTRRDAVAPRLSARATAPHRVTRLPRGSLPVDLQGTLERPIAEFLALGIDDHDVPEAPPP